MSDHERRKSRSASRSPKPDSWYMLVQEEVLVSSPSPSPRRSGSSSSSRASSKANSVSSTPRQNHLQPTSSTAAATDNGRPSQLDSSTLSEHPLEEESASPIAKPTSTERAAGGEGSSTAAARLDVISPLGGLSDSGYEPIEKRFDVPPLNLDASMESQDSGQFRKEAGAAGGIAGETFPFIEDDGGSSTMMSSDTDIPIPFSDGDDNEGNFPDAIEELDEDVVNDALQEAISEVSLDFVSGALSISQHIIGADKKEEGVKHDAELPVDSKDYVLEDVAEVHSSAATTPWQSEGGKEYPTPSPIEPGSTSNVSEVSNEDYNSDHRSLPSSASSSSQITDVTRTSLKYSSGENMIGSRSVPLPVSQLCTEDKTQGSPSKLPLDLESLKPLDIEGHRASGAEVVIVRGSNEGYHVASNDLPSTHHIQMPNSQHMVDNVSLTDGRSRSQSNRESTSSLEKQEASMGHNSRGSLPLKYLSPTEADRTRDVQAYINYPRELQSSQSIGLSSDSDSQSSERQLEKNRRRTLKDANVHQGRRKDHESEQDMLARRVALLLQVNSELESGNIHRGNIRQSGSFSGSASSSSSHTGSPDSIEEATLPGGILPREAFSSPSGRRTGDGHAMAPPSRSVSSSSTDSLAEHVKRLLQESESLRKLHEAGIDPRQLLKVVPDVGKASPTLSDASTSSSVRDIINRVARHSWAGSESSDGGSRPDDVYMSPSPTNVPMRSGSRSREDSGLQDSNKITFQQTFRSSRSREDVQSRDTSYSTVNSTVTNDSISQRVQHILNVTDPAIGQQARVPGDSLSREDLIALVQMAELEKKMSEGSVPMQRPYSPRSAQHSTMSSMRNGASSSVSGQNSSVASADSLAMRVKAILGREAPGERVDRIISEALTNAESGRVDQSESSISLGSKFSSTKSHTPSPREFEDPSIANLVQRPYGAYDRARDMLSLHLQRLTDKTFDHSVDTRTPYRQDDNANVIVNPGQYNVPSAHSLQQLSQTSFQSASSASLSKPISSEHVFFGLLPEQIPPHLQMPGNQISGEFLPLPLAVSSTKKESWQGGVQQQHHPYPAASVGGQPARNVNLSMSGGRQDLEDSLFTVGRSNSSPEIKVDKSMFPEAKAAASSHQRSGSWGRPSQFQQIQQPVSTSKVPIPTHSSGIDSHRYSPGRQHQEYPSQPTSITPQHLPSQTQQAVHHDYSTNSWPRSLSKSKSSSFATAGSEQKESSRSQSRHSLGKDSFLTDGFLKAYRPPGSTEVMYTYPVDGPGVQTADGSHSISTTTLESSHPGSDDARAPPFPASAYGNRTNRSPPNASKIPRLDGGVTSPPKGPQNRGSMQTLGSEGLLDDRRYRRSVSDTGRQHGQEKERVGRQVSLSPQHTAGGSKVLPSSRTSGMKREHSGSPPESNQYVQKAYDSRQPYDAQMGGIQQRDIPVRTSIPMTSMSEIAGARRQPHRFQDRPNSWDPSQQRQPLDPARVYSSEGRYQQQYAMTAGQPATTSTVKTSPNKIPRYRQGMEQAPARYAPVESDKADRRSTGRPDYPDGHYQPYGSRYGSEVPQLPGTYSKQVLQDILQKESDPAYHEATAMWDQYQHLRQQKEARRHERRVTGGDESDMSSLDSRRVHRLAHLVQNPVQHTVEQFIQDQDDSDSRSSSTLTDGSTPRQRRKWDRDRQVFTPREQSPDKTAKQAEPHLKVSPDDLALLVQTSQAAKESRIPRSSGRQNGSQRHEKKRRKDDKTSPKRSPTEDSSSSPTLQYDTSRETASDLATTQESLLYNLSLESDRLLQMLGPDGVRKLSSKLVKLQRKIDRQREQHRKREDEQKREAKKASSKKKGQRDEVPISSTPAIEDSSSSAASSAVEDASDDFYLLGKQASVEPSLSPVPEASIRSNDDIYSTESSPPVVPVADKKAAKQGQAKSNSHVTKRTKDVAHKDDFDVTYNESLSDLGSDTSVSCACMPKRSHSIHGITKRTREKASDKTSRETKMEVEDDEVFKKPSAGLSRIPVKDSNSKSRKDSTNGQAQQERAQRVKPGMAFVIDVGRNNGAKDSNVLTRRQNYSNKDVVDEDVVRRRRKSVERREKVDAKENEAPSRIPRKIVQPVAWFQPLNKKMPWQQGSPTKARPQPLSFPAKTEDADKKTDKSSLQEAFERHRSDFISKSRERQRKVKLAAEERLVQAQFDTERAHIFHDQRNKKSNPNAHPLSDQHHKPKKRAISRRQMKEQTEKLYNRLPEVKQKEMDRRKEQDFELNRIRAQIYRKKLSDKMKKKPWPGT